MKQVLFFSRTYKGFTLTEVLVSMFVFTIMMTSVSQIFSTTFLGYKNIRAVQRDIDNAQYSLNIIAKELRTSTMTNPTTGSLVNRTDIQFFDHSQDRCFRYRISGGSLQVASAVAADVNACSALTLNSFTTITTGVITGSFSGHALDSVTVTSRQGNTLARYFRRINPSCSDSNICFAS